MEISYGDLILESLLSDFMEASAIKSPFERETEFLPIKTNLLIAKKRIKNLSQNLRIQTTAALYYKFLIRFWDGL
ncbi:PF05638 family protein [Leptospira santarosai]|uniref:PF05638 family protein n=1 Tax=Leptospira santarosai TaxID=28183 RepID=A0A2P1QQ66_9LEPT|nr:PF05638 family protein [Leptospira santarosai]